MSATSTTRGRRLRPPTLERNAIALMISTGATSVLGVAFWAVAARTYSASAVGIASAEIAAMMLLASLAQLNLQTVFPRFLPSAGARTRRLLAAGYGAALVLSVLLASAFVLAGFGRHFLSGGTEDVIFIGSVAAWVVFATEDAALTGLRAAVWVPVENVSFSLAKVVLLVSLAAVFTGAHGILYAWILPIAAVILPLNWFIFFRLAPRRVAESEGRSWLPDRSALAAFVAGEYLGGIAQNVAVMVLPLIMVARLGPAAAGYFYVAWVVGSSFDVMLWNITTSLVVEATSAAAPLRTLTRRAIRLAILFVAPALLVAGIGAPLFLGLLGADYASHATTLLRLIVIAMPLRAVIELYMAFARLSRRIERVVAIQFANAIGVNALALALVGKLGLAGAGWAYLVTQALLVCVVGPLVVREYRS